MRAFNVDRDLSNNHVIAWNHSEFEVVYPSLSDEIKIGSLHVVFILCCAQSCSVCESVQSVRVAGDYYLRLLLEEDDADEKNEEHEKIKRS